MEPGEGHGHSQWSPGGYLGRSVFKLYLNILLALKRGLIPNPDPH
jgi:hypothetical protein